MKKFLLFSAGLIMFLTSCESTVSEKETISKEHAALIGTWQENDSLDSTIWIFDHYEVKWKGFTHYYRVSGDSLIISGMVYQLLEQSEEKLKILKLNGKLCTLIRKD